MVRIESTSNSIYKSTKKLLGRSERKKTGHFIVEGERIVRDAYKNGANINYIIVSDGADIPFEINDVKIYSMPDSLFDGLKSTVNSQGILAVVDYTSSDASEIEFSQNGSYLYLDSVTDPGNMGTILRSADAFGIDGVILSRGCVDVYNPKVIRSTMSGIFNIKLYFDDGDILARFKENGYNIIGTFPSGDNISDGFEFTDKCVIVMGNEANGISKETELMCTSKVTIPMTGGAESLNVSVACGIMLYESMIYKANRRQL